MFLDLPTQSLEVITSIQVSMDSIVLEKKGTGPHVCAILVTQPEISTWV